MPDYQIIPKFRSQPQRICTDKLFYCIIKTLGFFIYHRLSTGFTFRRHCCVSHNIFFSHTSLGCFSVLLERALHTFTFGAINDHNWSFCFFVSQTFDDPVLYKAVTTLWLSQLSSHIINVTCCFLPAILFYIPTYF